MRWRLALVGWLMMLAVAWVLLPRTVASEESPFEQIVVYPLESHETVRYRVYEDTEPDLRVLVWLETPAPEVLNEEESWHFGFTMTMKGPEGERVQEHWTRSRLTLLEDSAPAVATERTGSVVTDSRIIDLEPSVLARGGTITLQPLGLEPGQRLLVRVLKQRAPDDLLKRLPEGVVDRLERTYPVPWPALNTRERSWHLSRWHRALGADDVATPGIPLTLLAVPSLAPTSVDEGYRLGPGESTAVNLTGPATLWVEQTWEESGSEARLLPQVVSTHEVEGGELGATRVTVPEGTTWSLRWHNAWENDAVILRFTVDPPQGQSWGEPPGASGAQPQEPERRRISVYRAGPGRLPIEVPVDGGRPWGALRVEARPLAPDWILDPTQSVEAGATISFVVLDEQGEELGRGAWEAGYVHAPFERYVEISEERKHLFAPRDSEHPLRAEDDPIAERDIRYLYHRQGARTVVFEADALVDLRFLAPLEVEPEIAPEYGLPKPFLARYHPWELAPYVVIGPSNHEALVQAEQFFRFDATVRIEPREEPEDLAGGLRTWLVRPIEHFFEHPAFEKVRSRGVWRPWYRTLLGVEARLEVGPDGLEVDHRGSLGSLTLQCGEEEAWQATAELISSAGRVLLDLPEGQHTCSVDGPENTRLLASAKGDGAWYAWRSLYRADGRTLTVLVPKNEPKERLFIRAYTLDDQPLAPMEVLVDGGTPERTMNAHSFRTPARSFRTPEEVKGSAWLVNGGELVAWRGMQVTLGEDLLDGGHRVSITVPAGRTVLLRFDGTWVDPTVALEKHWVEAER